MNPHFVCDWGTVAYLTCQRNTHDCNGKIKRAYGTSHSHVISIIQKKGQKYLNNFSNKGFKKGFQDGCQCMNFSKFYRRNEYFVFSPTSHHSEVYQSNTECSSICLTYVFTLNQQFDLRNNIELPW